MKLKKVPREKLEECIEHIIKRQLSRIIGLSEIASKLESGNIKVSSEENRETIKHLYVLAADHISICKDYVPLLFDNEKEAEEVKNLMEKIMKNTHILMHDHI